MTRGKRPSASKQIEFALNIPHYDHALLLLEEGRGGCLKKSHPFQGNLRGSGVTDLTHW